jgi:hypothetical protein
VTAEECKKRLRCSAIPVDQDILGRAGVHPATMPGGSIVKQGFEPTRRARGPGEIRDLPATQQGAGEQDRQPGKTVSYSGQKSPGNGPPVRQMPFPATKHRGACEMGLQALWRRHHSEPLGNIRASLIRGVKTRSSCRFCRPKSHPWPVCAILEGVLQGGRANSHLGDLM